MKRKIVIRMVWILAGVWLVLLGVLYFSSGRYLNLVLKALQSELTNRLTTEVRIRKSNIHLSFIKSFPHAELELDSLLIRSAPAMDQRSLCFSGADTLLYAHRVVLVFDLRSLLSERYVLREVKIQEGCLYVLTDRMGKDNYSILRTTASDTLNDAFEMNLQKVSLNTIRLVYIYGANNVRVCARVNKSFLTGVFTDKGFNLHAKAYTQKVKYQQDDYLLQHNGSDYFETHLSEKGDHLQFNAIQLVLYGIPISGTGAYEYNTEAYQFKLSTRNASLRKLDASINSFYSEYVSLTPQKGNLDIDFQLTGKGSESPYYQVNYRMQDAVLRDDRSRTKLEAFTSQGTMSNGKFRNLASTSLRIDTLHCNSGGSHLELSCRMDNFRSPTLRAAIHGDLELGMLYLIPGLADKMILGGRLRGSFQLSGSLPSFSNLRPRHLKQVTASGAVEFQQATFESKLAQFPATEISGTCRIKSLTELELNDVEMQTGKSRLHLTGKLVNLPFMTTQNTIIPEIYGTIQASEFYVEDFISRSDSSQETEYTLQFPDSIRVTGVIQLDRFHYGRFEASQVTGQIHYTPDELQVSNFSMQTMTGSLSSNFTIRQSPDRITTTCAVQFKQVDIRELFYDFYDFGQDVITHNYLKGNLSGMAQVDAAWTNRLETLNDQLRIHAKLGIDQGELIQYPTLMCLSDFIAVEELQDIHFDHLETVVDVANEKVFIGPTRINSSALTLNASGEHDFQNRYTYRFQVYLADVLWKRAQRNKPVNTEFGYEVDNEDHGMMIPLKLTGIDTSFRVSYDRETARINLKEKLNQERNTWKQLLEKPGEAEKVSGEQPILETDESQAGEKAHILKKTQEKTKSSEPEFRVIWDDE